MRLTRFFRLKESVRQLQAREGINGVAFRLKEEPFRIDPAELIFGETGIFYLTNTGALTRVTLYDSEQRVDSEQMDTLLRANVVCGGFDNISLIEKLPRYHFLFCKQLQEHHSTDWHEPKAWQISHRDKNRFIFSYTTKSGVLCDMDTQHLLPCTHCIKAMHELGYMKTECIESSQLRTLLDSNDFYSRRGTIRPSSCPSAPKCLWVDWHLLALRYQAFTTRCANLQNNTNPCDRTGVTSHYSHRDVTYENFHYLTNLCQPCHQQKRGHEHLHLAAAEELA